MQVGVGQLIFLSKEYFSVALHFQSLQFPNITETNNRLP